MIRRTTIAALVHDRPLDRLVEADDGDFRRIDDRVCEAMPPSLPRLVTVIVEPASSSRVALLVRARSGHAADLGGELHRAQRSAHCAPPEP